MAEEPKKQEKETPEDSSSETKPQDNLVTGSEKEDSQTPQDKETPEEAQWESLKGPTQDRIKQLIRERDEWKTKVTDQTTQDLNRVTGYERKEPSNNEIDQAADALLNPLKGKGLVTKDDLYQMVDFINRNRTHEKLEEKYDGSDGLPKYDKAEVEDYMNRKAKEGSYIGDPEAAFRNMYFDEFVDAKRTSQRRGTYVSEKPGASSAGREEPLSVETFREKLSGPKAKEYYDKLAKNPALFDEIVSKLSQG